MSTQFQAGASALGYVYQFRYGLLQALESLRDGLEWSIGIETADDVEVVKGGSAQLAQLKHRASGVKLTDGSPDLWKSLRIWAEGVKSGQIDVDTSRFLLVTTGELPLGSVAATLGPEASADEKAATVAKLDAAAATATGEGLKKARDAWDALSGAEKRALVQATTVLGQSDDVTGTLDAIHRTLRLSTRKEMIPAMGEVLEGWWIQRCIRGLTGVAPSMISGVEFDAQFSAIREQFLPDNLPILPEVYSEDRLDPAEFADRIFVQQLGLTQVSAQRIGSAIRDYMRAFAQRSFWLRNELVFPDELGKYEQRLVEEWEYVFNRWVDELPPEAAEDEKLRAARAIYAWVEEASAPPIRDLFSDRFMVRGSFHILSDDLRAGWHPDFLVRLMSVLEPAT